MAADANDDEFDVSVSIEDDDDVVHAEEEEQEEKKEEKKTNRRSVAMRLPSGLMFKSENEEVTHVTSPLPPSADELIQFQVQYPDTLVPVGAEVPIHILVTNLPDDISSLSYRTLTAEIKTPQKITEKKTIEMRDGETAYSLSFVASVSGVYKAMVRWALPLQNKPCRIRAGAKSKKRAMNMNRPRDRQHASTKDADVDADLNPMRLRKKKGAESLDGVGGREGGEGGEGGGGEGGGEGGGGGRLRSEGEGIVPVGRPPAKTNKSSVTPVSRDLPSLSQTGVSDDSIANSMRRRPKASPSPSGDDVPPPMRSRAATTIALTHQVISRRYSA